MTKDNDIEVELEESTPEYEVTDIPEPLDVTIPEYKPQPTIQDGWASGWCEKCHKRYTNAPMVDGVIYAPCHTKLE